jgi:hypothetical protein
MPQTLEPIESRVISIVEQGIVAGANYSQWI